MATINYLKSLPTVDTITRAIMVERFLGKNNTRKYNLTKCAEELTELAQVCLKLANKKQEYAPERYKDMQDNLIEEIGDVTQRMKILCHAEKISPYKIAQRRIMKANKYLGYIQETTFSDI